MHRCIPRQPSKRKWRPWRGIKVLQKCPEILQVIYTCHIPFTGNRTRDNRLEQSINQAFPPLDQLCCTFKVYNAIYRKPIHQLNVIGLTALPPPPSHLYYTTGPIPAGADYTWPRYPPRRSRPPQRYRSSARGTVTQRDANCSP